LIISQNLRSEIDSVQQAINNSQRASNVIATTEGALNEVANLLNDIQGKVVEAANSGAISDDEIKANQLQIDSAIASITRIANTTASAIMAAVNLVSDSTGVSASLINGGTPASGIRLLSKDFGSSAFVQVHELGTTVGAFPTQDAGGANVTRDVGRDVAATIN